MKYDSSMTQYHDDILAAVRLMCGKGSDITKQFRPDDGSPAPLRDYLKNMYGNRGGSGKVRYRSFVTKGVDIYFNDPLNNDGDKTLTLSWSQTAKFIRDNWDEIFKKPKPKTSKSGGTTNMTAQWDKTHLCRKYNEDDCEYFLQTDTETILDGKKLNKCCYYCTSENKVRKIGNGGTWTGISPKFCPKRKAEEAKETSKMSKRCRELLADSTAPEPQEERAAETDKPKPTYKDVLLEHYPNFDVNWFEEFAKSVCVAYCFIDDDPKCTFEAGCEKHWESECMFEWRDELRDLDSEDIEEYLKSADDSADTETADLPNPPVPANTENPPAPFDYSELDSDTAKNLMECETVIRRETAGYFTQLGAKFKEAQGLLANHASGTFEKWYTSIGFKRQTVYNLIQRYEFLSSPTIGGRAEEFEALPLTLSYEVSKPDAPKELVEKVLDGDITTNAEYLKLKAELDRTREECRQIDANSAAKDKEYKQQLDEASERVRTAEMQARTYKQNYLQMEKNFDEMSNENISLEKQIKELESRPTEVIYEKDEDTLRELKELREENEQLKNKDIKTMLLRITLNDYDLLLKTVKENARLYAAVSRAEIIKL